MMSRTPPQRFCTQCGQVLLQQDSFCTRCGSPVRRKPRSTFRRILPIALPVWIAVLAVAFVLSFAFGFAHPDSTALALSGDHAAALNNYGEPTAFWLTDGPGAPESADTLRIEQWFYPDDGFVLTFIDGVLIGTEAATFTTEFAPHSIAPHQFDRTMTPSDVENLLGESGIPLTASAAEYPDYKAYAYQESRIAVGYSNGQLLTAQTY